MNIREFLGWIAAVSAFVLLLAGLGRCAERPLTAEDFIDGAVIRVPTPAQCDALDAPNREVLGARLGHYVGDLCGAIRAGVLPGGEPVDMGSPVNAFTRAFNEWLELRDAAVRQRSLDYDELLALRRLEKAFERMVRWADKDRTNL